MTICPFQLLRRFTIFFCLFAAPTAFAEDRGHDTPSVPAPTSALESPSETQGNPATPDESPAPTSPGAASEAQETPPLPERPAPLRASSSASDESAAARALSPPAPVAPPEQQEKEPPAAAESTEPPEPEEPEEPAQVLPEKAPALIQIGRKTIYAVRVDSPTQAAEERARNARKSLLEAIKLARPETVRVVEEQQLAVVYAAEIPLLKLFPEDAVAAGEPSLRVHADDVALRFRQVIEDEQKRSALSHSVFSISLAVLFSLIALYLLRRTSDLTEHARRWLEKNRSHVPALRVQSLELISPTTMRSGATVGVEVSKWLARLLIVYLWFLVTFSQFNWARGYVHEITSTFLRPLSEMLQRIALSLPLAGVTLIALGTLAILLRFLSLFFAGVARGETSLPWLRAEHALPTSLLLRLLLILCALLFIAPLVTGDSSGVLSLSGVILLAVLGLAGAPLLASVFVGAVLIYGQKIQLGDELQLGAHQGKVVHLGLLSVQLQTPLHTYVRVPSLLFLFHPVLRTPPSRRIQVELSLPLLNSSITERLTQVGARLGTQVSVEVLNVQAQGAQYRVSLLGSSTDDTRTALFLALAEEFPELLPHNSLTQAQPSPQEGGSS